MPSGKWNYYQEWNNAIFLHWKVAYEDLRDLVPQELDIDTFEGSSWVSVVLFTMERIRPRYLPAFPPISNFEEINIRTYVSLNGKLGVYFLSIEGGKKLSCSIAKRLSELPYRYSRIERKLNSLHSSNQSLGDGIELEYEIGNAVMDKKGIDLWLTERYALFQDSGDHINAFEIHHVEWPVFHLNMRKIEINYPRFKDILIGNPDRVHYSTGVQVLAWESKQIKRTN